MATNWCHAYEKKLKGLPRFAAFEQIVNCIWKYGILAHFSPTSPACFRNRIANKTPVWRRADARLYWRILYAAHGALHAHRKSWTVSGESIVTWPVAMACKYIHGENPFIRATEAVAQRAERELRKLGVTPHRIPFGTKGLYKGISVEVGRHSNFGCIVLAVAKELGGDEQYFAWQKLDEILGYNGRLAEPWDLDPADFAPRKDTAAAHS